MIYTIQSFRQCLYKSQTNLLLRERERNAALLENAKLQYETDKANIRKNAELKNAKTEIEKKYEMVCRYFDHLERQDEMKLLCSRNYTGINSDAMTLSMIGLLGTPQSNPQIASAPQLPALEMPQANSSSNSSNSVVLHK